MVAITGDNRGQEAQYDFRFPRRALNVLRRSDEVHHRCLGILKGWRTYSPRPAYRSRDGMPLIGNL